LSGKNNEIDLYISKFNLNYSSIPTLQLLQALIRSADFKYSTGESEAIWIAGNNFPFHLNWRFFETLNQKN